MDSVYIRTISGQWEQVTPYVYNHRAQALNDDGTPRYGEKPACISIFEGKIYFQGEIQFNDMSRICRFLGITVAGGTFEKPLVVEPETMKFKIRNSTVLHHLTTGDNWVKKAA